MVWGSFISTLDISRMLLPIVPEHLKLTQNSKMPSLTVGLPSWERVKGWRKQRKHKIGKKGLKQIKVKRVGLETKDILSKLVVLQWKRALFLSRAIMFLKNNLKLTFSKRQSNILLMLSKWIKRMLKKKFTLPGVRPISSKNSFKKLNKILKKLLV